MRYAHRSFAHIHDLRTSRERWLTAATYLSSRAFPSTLLSPNPSLVATPSSHPVLLPGIDSLNHARAHPVSWIVDIAAGKAPSSSAPDEFTISLVEHLPISTGSEIFNNYGPKPNAELLLGYGFVLPENPDDTIVLRVGGPSAVEGTGKRWEIGRNGQGMDGLWEEIVQIVTPHAHTGDPLESDTEAETQPPGWSIHLDAAGALQSMVEGTLDRLPSTFSDGLRSDVREMIVTYVKGQRDILESVALFALEKERDALETAAAQGVEVVIED